VAKNPDYEMFIAQILSGTDEDPDKKIRINRRFL